MTSITATSENTEKGKTTVGLESSRRTYENKLGSVGKRVSPRKQDNRFAN